MNLELTDEQIALRDTVRSYLAERASTRRPCPPTARRRHRHDRAGVARAAELGATGLLVPAEYDGAGMTMVEAGIVAEELGAGLHPGPWLSTAVAATRALTRFEVANDLAAPLFTGIADGSTIATVGPLECARPSVVEHGDGIALRGEIDNVWDAGVADVVFVVADDRDGTGLFAVQTSSPGFDSTLQAGIDQTRKRFRVRLATRRPTAGDRVTRRRRGADR